ncbi:MAG: DUF6435 family protein [Litorivicinus sp.]
MFGLFKKDPKKALEKERQQLLEQAMKAQRSGDIRGYSELSEKAEKVFAEIQKLD